MINSFKCHFTMPFYRSLSHTHTSLTKWEKCRFGENWCVRITKHRNKLINNPKTFFSFISFRLSAIFSHETHKTLEICQNSFYWYGISINNSLQLVDSILVHDTIHVRSRALLSHCLCLCEWTQYSCIYHLISYSLTLRVCSAFWIPVCCLLRARYNKIDL